MFNVWLRCLCGPYRNMTLASDSTELSYTSWLYFIEFRQQLVSLGNYQTREDARIRRTRRRFVPARHFPSKEGIMVWQLERAQLWHWSSVIEPSQYYTWIKPGLSQRTPCRTALRCAALPYVSRSHCYAVLRNFQLRHMEHDLIQCVLHHFD